MNCPFCQGEMQHGVLQMDGRGGLIFQQEGKKRTLGDMLTGVGAIQAEKKGLSYKIKLEADYCEACKKMIFDAEVGK